MLSRPAAPHPRPAALANWLAFVAVLVFLMIVVGGITRLTESGLSMVRWEPISGAIPPLSEGDWQAEFDHYRQTPQYQQTNRGMTLDDFKTIFFWEYVHRLLGRLIGLAFALPLAWFWWKRSIPSGYGGKLTALLALGGLQGAIGWWMVASGLVDVPEVSHVRLAVHLLLALLILGALVWVALDLGLLADTSRSAVLRHRERSEAIQPAGDPGLLRRSAPRNDDTGINDPPECRSPAPRARMPTLAIWGLCLLFLQFLFGAYVAGLEAGYAFNTWPLMGDEFFPSAAPVEEGFPRLLADNPIVVQFVHRWLAFPVAALAIWLGVRGLRRRLGVDAWMLIGAVAAQLVLGILTILSGVQIDIAVAHQGMAALLLAAMVNLAHRLGRQSDGG